MEEIAELLKETRENAGIDLLEVSRDINITEIILENIEAGKIGSFKDIFLLKEYIYNYAKYLGLDADDLLKNFNEYVFEYTSKIPVKEIERTIEQAAKNTNSEDIMSPYTLSKHNKSKRIYFLIGLLLFILIILVIGWSINQFTINNKTAYVISYRK